MVAGALKNMLFQMAHGVAFLHGKEIVHRDIKPNNILISSTTTLKRAEVKLADFGLCRVLKKDNEDFLNTNMSNPSGTRGWIAPELYDSGNYDYKVDIFPLGCVFFYTLTGGHHPFGDSLEDIATRIRKKKPMHVNLHDMNEYYSNINDSGFELIKSMVEMDPSKRPTAAEILKNTFFANQEHDHDHCRSFDLVG